MNTWNPRVPIAVGAFVVLAGSIVAIVWQWRGGAQPKIPTHEWYFDVNTRQLFVTARGQVSPLPAPSGPLPDGQPAGVRAYVYGCGDCAQPNRFIAHLEMATPAMQAKLKAPLNLTGEPRAPGYGEATPGRGVLVSRPDEIQWFEASTPDGQQIEVLGLYNRCPPGVVPRRCYPR